MINTIVVKNLMLKITFLIFIFFFKINYAFAYVGLGAFAPFLWQIILVIIIFIISFFSIFYTFFKKIFEKIFKKQKTNKEKK